MKIPKRAKRVFQGIIYDVYQWKEKNFDGSTGVFEAVRRTDSVQVIPLVGRSVCVNRERQPGTKPFYAFVGGRADGGETPLAAAKRELREETGLASSDWELLHVYDAPGRIEWRIYYYVARDCKKVAKPTLDPGEKITVKKVSFAEFFKLLSRPDFRGGKNMLDLVGMQPAAAGVRVFRKRLFGA